MLGFVDGIRGQIKRVRQQQLRVAWTNYVHDQFDRRPTSKATARQKCILLAMGDSPHQRDDLISLDWKVRNDYRDVGERTLSRDLNTLKKAFLVVRLPDGRWMATCFLVEAFLPTLASSGDGTWRRRRAASRVRVGTQPIVQLDCTSFDAAAKSFGKVVETEDGPASTTAARSAGAMRSISSAVIKRCSDIVAKPTGRQTRKGSKVDVVVVDTAVIRSAGDLAESQKLRGYDAVHLAASPVSGATVFASADDRLLAAARRHRLATSNPIEPLA